MMRATMTGADLAGSLDWYFDEIRGDGLLSAAEEKALAEAIAHGDRDARTKLIRSNLRLVVRIARDYTGRGLSMDDLVGEGNLGLIRAAGDFDPRFGARFSTYAAHWIKQSIRQAIINTAATIRLPAHMVGLLTKWRRAEKALRREIGHEPTADQIADVLGLSEAQRDMVSCALQARTLRRDADRSHDDNDARTSDDMPDHSDAPESIVEADELRRNVLSRLDRLDERERSVVALRFGLDGHEPSTLKEIGRRLGVTREWVRKIEQKAVRKLEDRPGHFAIPHAAAPKTAPHRTTRMA